MHETVPMNLNIDRENSFDPSLSAPLHKLRLLGDRSVIKNVVQSMLFLSETKK
jgi:hypothetical protein